ncbi:MAG: hypothetical protein PHS96_07395 [Anaerolineales bacterium]|nr:hypothetical protein [Anaerolineales bacterium]
MKTHPTRIALLAGLLCSLTLACSLLGGAGDQASNTRETLQAAVTSVSQGNQFLQTAQAIATQAGDSAFMATEFADAGLKETALAVVTQEAPGWKETTSAIASQGVPALEQTIQAIAGRVAGGEVPSDIPLAEGEKEVFCATSSFVSYTTTIDLAAAVDFYLAQMPSQGWTLQEGDSATAAGVATLSFTKADRLASITLTEAGSKTLVVIVIEPQ